MRSIISNTAKTLSLAAALMLVAIFLSLYSTLGLIDANSWVVHTHKVISELNRCQSIAEKSEVVLRGYVLTGRPDFLREYAQTEGAYLNSLHSVMSLTQDNTLQQKNAVALNTLMDSLSMQAKTSFEQSSNVIAWSGDRRLAASVEERRLLLNTFRAKVAAMIHEEQSLLSVRNAHLRQMQRFVWTGMGSLCILAFFCLFQVYRQTREYVSKQESAKAVLEGSNKELALARDSIAAALAEAMEEGRKASEAEARFLAVLSSMGEGVYQLDVKGNLVYMNPAGEAILGYRLADVLGSNMHDLVHGKSEEKLESHDDNCPLRNLSQEQCTIENSDDVFVRKDGAMVPVQYFCAPFVVNGVKRGAVVSFQDVGDRKASERRLRDFYATLSHELRTPLSSVLASLVLIDNGLVGELSGKAQRLVSISRSECDRVVRLINDILDLSKIESGMFELNLSPKVPAPIVEKAVAAQMGLVQQRGIRINTELHPTPEILCDEDRILQVINNLLTNAIKYSPDNAKIDVSVGPVDGNVRVSIKDEGPGIPESQIYKLFKRFQRLESSLGQSGTSGTGLGLAISKALVEQHGGIIGVDSELGKGTVFWFSLPMGGPETHG